MKRFATTFLGLVLALATAVGAYAQQDVTVREINAIPQENIDALNAAGAGLESSQIADLAVSPLVGETVRITAVVLMSPRTSGLGTPDATTGFPSRVHVFVRDTTAASQGVAGMGVQLVDGSYQTTGLLNVAVGDVITVVGLVEVFTGSGGASLQVSPQTIELLGPYTDFGLPDSILDPVLLDGTSDVNMSVAGDGQVQVNWSNYSDLNGQYVRIEGAAMANRDISSDRPNWLVTSDGGETVVNFYDVSLRYRNDRDGGYTPTDFNVRDINDDFVPPPPGARVNIQGFLIFQGDDPFARGEPDGALFSIAPIEDSDLEVTETPPNVTSLSKPDFIPSSGDAVTINATVEVDPARTADAVSLNYFTSDDATEQVLAMTDNGDGTYSAEIPAQADGTFVIYSVTASDNTGAEFTSRLIEYRVLDDGINEISDIQEVSGLASFDGPFAGFTTDMNLTATVQTEPGTSGLIALQDDPDLGPWSGVVVRFDAALVADLQRGDVINITNARIEESFGLTRLRDITYTKTGSGDALGYKAVSTDVLQDADVAEAHEGMLLRFDNVTVITPQADGNNDFGEFAVSSTDADAAVRVDDASSAVSEFFNETLTEGQALEFIQGLWSFSFSNYKLMPEDANDFPASLVINVDTEDQEVPGKFVLSQNYPNPFNPVTTIAYEVPQSTPVRLEVFDMLGRSVALLVDGTVPAGTYQARFDARSLASGMYLYRLTAGNQVIHKTMLLLK